jgi:hypothetical protein
MMIIVVGVNVRVHEGITLEELVPITAFFERLAHISLEYWS